MTQSRGNDLWIETLSANASESDRGWGKTLCVSVLFGLLGFDRFYLGSGLLGLLKLCTFGGFGLWWIFDVVLLLAGRMRDAEGRVVRGPFG